jgi:hypothetical protein
MAEVYHMIVHQRFQGSGGLSCNTQVNTTNFKDPRIKNPGVFLLVQCNKLRERGPGNALKTCSERAATRMESLLWEEKLDRIKALYRDGYTHSVVRHSLRY